MIHVFARVHGKLARWDYDAEDYVEAITAVVAEANPPAPVLALLVTEHEDSRFEEKSSP